MNKEKDIDNILNLARQAQIGRHAAAKRYYQYSGGAASKRCKYCQESIAVNYGSGPVLQCEVIGIAGTESATLNPGNCCKKFTR